MGDLSHTWATQDPWDIRPVAYCFRGNHVRMAAVLFSTTADDGQLDFLPSCQLRASASCKGHWQTGRETEQECKVCQWRHEGFAKDDYRVLTIKFSSK